MVNWWITLDENMNPWLAYTLLLAIGLFGGIGDILTYQWAKSQQQVWLWAAFLIWAIDIVLFGLYLRYETVSLIIAYTLTLMLHTLIVLICDLYFYGTRLNRMEWTGLLLALLAIILLEVGRTKHTSPESVTPSAVESR